MRTAVKYGRVKAHPGNYGTGDWRVTFNGSTPTHAECVFLVGMLLCAEDRYRGTRALGRFYLYRFYDRLWWARTPDDVRAIAEEAARA